MDETRLASGEDGLLGPASLNVPAGVRMAMATRRFAPTTGDKIARMHALARVLDPAVDLIVSGGQCHGRNVEEIEAPDAEPPNEGDSSPSPRHLTVDNTDAFITRAPHVVLACYTADCVPIVATDRRGEWIGIAHAGWRGTLAGVAALLVDSLIGRGVAPSDLRVWIAPAICAENYEVGPEVIEMWRAEFGAAADDLYRGRQLDLRATNIKLIQDAGVPDGSIEASPYCTYGDSDRFFSYRRDQTCGGHLITGVVKH